MILVAVILPIMMITIVIKFVSNNYWVADNNVNDNNDDSNNECVYYRSNDANVESHNDNGNDWNNANDNTNKYVINCTSDGGESYQW